ncbi:FliH/SctL family protein [Plastoroseomonas hellenica]|uniref:hypothetical protein n=1 Tax=Plastoroseomonas hellenica TaxID=2687306 RepID=UPI001BA85F58|nr:hypothetical protein [Plastoroseomonas hellenica]MBR0642216.1 hypothetical protein [Plastoroseomonas hellenica]
MRNSFAPLSISSLAPVAEPGRSRAMPVTGFAPSFRSSSPPVPTDPAALLAEAMEAARVVAREEGHAEGHAAALAEVANAQDAVIAAALATLPSALTRLTEAAGNAAREEARTLAGVVLTAFDAALPAAATRATPDAAAYLAARLAPLLEQETRVTLHVAPELAEAVAARIADPRLTVVPDTRQSPGDLRAEWRGGTASFDLAARRAAIRSALAEAGLALENDP